MEPTIYKPSIYNGAGIYNNENCSDINYFHTLSFTTSNSTTLNGIKITNEGVLDKDTGRCCFIIDNPNFSNYDKIKFKFRFRIIGGDKYPQIIGEYGSFWHLPNIWFTGADNDSLNFGIPDGTDNWTHHYLYNGIIRNTFYTSEAEIDNVNKFAKVNLFDTNGILLDSKTIDCSSGIIYRTAQYIIFLGASDSYHNFNGSLDLKNCGIWGDNNKIW